MNCKIIIKIEVDRMGSGQVEHNTKSKIVKLELRITPFTTAFKNADARLENPLFEHASY